MNEIIPILMQRDQLTESQAIAVYQEGRTAALEALEEGADAEEVFADYFGLEIDYMVALL